MKLNLFGLSFNLYGLLLGFGILAGLESASWLAAQKKVEKKIVDNLFWWVVIGGIIGARTYHVIDKWKEIYSLDPQSILFLWNGGLGIWGAIIGGVVGALLSLKLNHQKISLDLLDIIFFGVPLGQAIGRWGNYFNNELVGKNGEPLFFYESSLDLVLFVLLVWLAKKKVRPGVVTGTYLLGYGLIRLALEPLRPDGIIWKIAGAPAASIASVVAILVGISFILRRRS